MSAGPTSAAAIRRTWAALRESGRELRARPAREVLDALAAWVETWRAPDSAFRRELGKTLPDATGLHPATVAEGLARATAPWSADALHALVARELGDPGVLEGAGSRLVRGFDTTAVLLAGSLPTPSLLSLLAPLVLRSPLLAKPAVHDPVTAPLAQRALADLDAGLGRCLAIADVRGADETALDALLEADCVVATGADATVARVAARAARVGPPRRLVTYGHRLSLAAVGPEALHGPALEATAEALALDVALWDQQGCLSPIAVYAAADDPAAADRLGEALARALERAEARWPRGRVPTEAAARAAHESAAAELRAAAGARVAVHGGGDAAWCVVREADALARPAPLYRFVRIHPVADADALVAAVAPLARHLAAVAVDGFAERRALGRALLDLGASRVCRAGNMQAPPLDWRHDGRGVLEPLARSGELE